MLIKKVIHASTLACFLSTSLFSTNRDETTYCDARTTVVHNNLAARYGETDTAAYPRIGFCWSGGGLRALISTLGFMLGAEAIGLLGICLYISALSGSTWMLGNYYARQQSLVEVKNHLRTNLERDFFDGLFPTISQIAAKLESHYRSTGELQMAHLWGGLIAERTMADLGDAAHTIPFSALIPAADTIDDHHDFVQKYPFPIFSVVHPVVSDCCSCWGAPDRTMRYNWFEITPYYMRETFSSNIRSLGDIERGYGPRSGEQGIPLTLGYVMGTCGSAYSVSPRDLTAFFKDKIQGFFMDQLGSHYATEAATAVPDRDRGILLQAILNSIRFGRLAPARIPFAGEELIFVDAGLYDNLPLQPLLERNMDIIFICDASNNAYNRKFPELKKAADIEHAHGRHFPSLRNGKILTDEVIIFEDEDNPSLPVLVYFHNPFEFDTTKMSYTAEEFDQLCDYMERAVGINAAIIAATIKTVARKKAG